MATEECPPEVQDQMDLKAIRSRLKMRALHMKALGATGLAHRYFKAAYELEDNLVEKVFLAAEAALLELESLEEVRPDLAGQMDRAWKRLLEEHGLKRTKRRSK